ncbi:serine hydrolase domain-containing protein [Vibrio sp. Hal054]|uniref:serine hydrolase domain-containing protein n=1 Tax=Vibrio sp. Hal054 TaxID=3035158 RepID=UPI00301D9741
MKAFKETCFVIGFLFLLGCTSNDNGDLVRSFSDLNETTPGCAVGIIKNNRFLYEGYFGQSNLKYNIPIDKKTVFNIGSNSKHITASLVLLLESEGKLSRSDSLEKYYQDGPDWFKDITLYHLLHHQSGLPDYINDIETRNGVIRQLVNESELASGLTIGQPIPKGTVTTAVVNWMKGLDSPIFKSGSLAIYSNTGYLLLADIVEKASGVEFNKLAEDRLFKPLGMESTTIHGKLNGEIKWSATGYIDFGDGVYRPTENNIVTQGTSGVKTTLSDYAKWISHLMTPKTDKELWVSFLNPDDPVYGKAPTWKSGLQHYSNGLVIFRTNKGSSYTHGGLSIDGMASDFWFSPKLKLGYIQLCNFNTTRRVDILELAQQYGG